MIDLINGMIRAIVNGLNAVIGAMNKIKVTIPDWVPVFGGQTWGVSIPTVTAPQIPRLATGAVIPPNAEFAAIFGDQRSGRNIEAPEGLIRQIIREEMGKLEAEIGINFERMAAAIRKQMKELFPKHTQFIAEPGRFFAGPAGILVTQVVGRAFRDNKNFYYLNDGIYQDFSGMMFDHCKYEFKTLRRGQKYMSALAGPTCDSLDILSSNEEIPELFPGDVVYVKNIGAYSCASAVPNFNGFEPAKIILV